MSEMNADRTAATEVQDVVVAATDPDREIDQELVDELLAQASEQDMELLGEGGLLRQLTKQVLETALDVELTEHLGLRAR